MAGHRACSTGRTTGRVVINMSNTVLKVVLAASLVLVGAGSARAQNIHLAAGDADLTLRGVDANAQAGVWMDRGALDTSDGRRDLVIGAPGIAGTLGHVYVMNGGPEPKGDRSLGSTTSNTIISGTENGDLFGYTGAIGNIFNAEGSERRNLVVGAPGASSGRGAVYLFRADNFGNFTRIDTDDADVKIIGNTGDQLGSAVATADLDHDTFREVIVGARGTGRVYIIRGTTLQSVAAGS